jgi:hypothetical protein
MSSSPAARGFFPASVRALMRHGPPGMHSENAAPADNNLGRADELAVLQAALGFAELGVER